MTLRAVLTGVVLSWMLADTASAQTTVRVDCSRGRSLNRILRTVPARVLVIEVRGTCVENVLVTRSNVTLRGVDPAVDGIRATSSAPGSVAITVRDAQDVAIERLSVSEGYIGVRALAGAVLRVSGARLTGNAVWGAEVWDGGAADFEDTVIDRNGLGGVWTGGTAQCRRCTIVDNLDPNTAVYVSELMILEDSTVSGSTGLTVDAGARAWLTRTDLAGATVALRLIGGHVGVDRGTLVGPFWADGGTLRLRGVGQDAGGDANLATNNAHLQLEGSGSSDTTIPRSLRLDRFSHAVVQGGSVGPLTCASGADAWCDATASVATSTCSLCPRP